jgi:murein DD-endopeptidase MepM/ murein hydrolase activator NlpD
LNEVFVPAANRYKRRSSKKTPIMTGFLVILFCLAALFYFTSGQKDEDVIIPHESELAAELQQGTEEDKSANKTEPATEDAEAKERIVQEPILGVIEEGDTAGDLLNTWLSPGEIHNLAGACKLVHPLERLKVGQPYVITPAADGASLDRFEYEIDGSRKLVIYPTDAGFAAELQSIVYDVEYVRVEGVITSNLFQTVTDSGERASLAIALADIFAWEVDFIRDIREGDSFVLLVEKRYRDGEFKSYGAILAATFTNQGQARSAFLFVDEFGNHHYFAEDGASMRHSFLKAPLSFTRISSVFTYKRKHPIFKDVRKHEGIDYAAPAGTPVKTVGSGSIKFAGKQGGYGNLVIVRHTNGYETYYAHLSKYAQGIKKGASVRQGQVIGYVGMTGWATGPHLDFRIKKSGTFINPATMANPRTEPVPKKLRPVFDRRVALLAKLLTHKGENLLVLAELEPLPVL